MICFCWFVSTDNSTPSGAEQRLLDSELRLRLRDEIARLARNMPAKEHRRKGIEETLVRVIMRGLPKDDEIHRLLGVLSQAADAFEDSES